MDIKKLSGILGLLTLCASIVGGVYAWVDSTVATKEYHTQDVTRLQGSLGRIESNSLVPRVINALQARCELIASGGSTTFVDEVLLRLESQYLELEGREFPRGKCVDGERVRN